MSAITLAPAPEHTPGERIFVWLAAAMAAVAFVAFAPTYWLQLPAGTFAGSGLVHLHAILFSGWMLLMAWQAWQAAQGRLKRHRAHGLVGISLASLMVVVGLAMAIDRVHGADAAGYGAAARAFMIVQVSGVALFAGLVGAAIALARRPGWHARLMVAATASLLQAAVGRIPFAIIHGMGPGLSPGHFAPPPLGVIVGPEMSVNLFLVAGLIYDVRKRGRPHPAWPVGLASIAIVTLLRAPLAHTPAWLGLADALARFAG